MKNFLCLVALLCAATAVQAQINVKKLKKAAAIAVTYQSSYNGHAQPGGLVMTVSGNEVSLESKREETPDNTPEQQVRAPKTANYINYATHEALRRATLPDGRVVSATMPFVLGKGLETVGDEPVLGLPCTKYRTSVNSNTIEIWATTELPFRGTPQANVGVPEGLVLKVVRNGQMVQEAVGIEAAKTSGSLLPTEWGERMDASVYQWTLNQSVVTTVSVFDQERIAFNGAKLPEGELQAGRVYQAGGGTIILKKVKLPDYVEDRNVFAEVVQYSDGDAYDRTGSVFVITEEKAQSFFNAIRDLNSTPSFRNGDVDYHGLVSDARYTVPTELMRFFTGFGVRKFNSNHVPGQHWADSVVYKTEVTALCEKLQGEVWVGAYIGNWDKNGHKVSLKLKYYPDDLHRVNTVVPLFNTVNYLEQAGQPYPLFMGSGQLEATFQLDQPVKGARLYYLTTGHGGWGGGDEFNQKVNTITCDGRTVANFIPWRDDCGTYRNNSPCSGNFSNGLSSSDLSRSNWCPGTVTNPEYIPLGDLDKGPHRIVVTIPQGAPEGGSNSYWCISGSLIY